MYRSRRTWIASAGRAPAAQPAALQLVQQAHVALQPYRLMTLTTLMILSLQRQCSHPPADISDDTDELDSASPRASIPVSSSHTPSRLSDAPRMLALAEVDESADIAARNGPTEQLAPQTLKKGKHRSHVWGWFESKRKSKLADGSGMSVPGISDLR